MRRMLLIATCVIVAAGCGSRTQDQGVDAARLAAADREPGQWLSTGRTWDEQRHSPLRQIDTENVAELSLAWYADLDTNRGQEATPLVIDGVLYVSTAWSKVLAFDAATGKPLWSYNPKVPPEWGARGCCDVVNRGVAAWGKRIFVGSYDGRLIALDAATGEPVWEVNTVDRSQPYTITGAPRVVKGKVLIGNGGAELGVRGYVSAYDAEDGEERSRFVADRHDDRRPALRRRIDQRRNLSARPRQDQRALASTLMRLRRSWVTPAIRPVRSTRSRSAVTIWQSRKWERP